MRAPPALANGWFGLIAAAAVALVGGGPLRAQTLAAVNDTYGTPPGTPLQVAAAAGVLANDFGSPLTAVLVSTVSHGVLLLDGGGGFFYLANIGFTGNDSFTYQVVSGGVTSNVATVTIAVNSVNDPPAAVADSYATDEGTTLNVAAGNGVLRNDSDAERSALTAVLATAASSGTVTLNADGSFSYVPAAAFFGTVTFAYEADDGAARSAATTVTITVNAVNDPPAATADSYATNEDSQLVVNAANGVLANDTDPDPGTTLTAALIGNITSGTLALQPDGSFAYTPAANFNGSATFTYQARDGSASSSTVTVTIAVAPVNDPPFVTNAPATTATEGVTYGYTLTASDPDGNPVTITAPTLPRWLRFVAPANITGTPTQSDAGNHDLVMEVTDGIAPPVLFRFRIAVQVVDDPPTIAPIPTQSATEGTPYDLNLATFVTDSDTAASALRYTATSALPAGLALSSAGRFTGTPAFGTSVGTHTIRLRVEDAANAVTGQFTLTVLLAGRVDLGVTLSATPSPAPLDGPTAWNIVVTNRSPGTDAAGVSLTALFRGNAPYRFDVPPPPGCTVTPSGNQNTLSCTLGPLAGGATNTVTLTGRSSVAGDVYGTATVSLSAGGLDEVPGNDRGSGSLSVAQRVSSAPAQRIANVSARAVAAADLDADGFDDLAVAADSAQGLLLFANVADAAGLRHLATSPQALGGEALGNDIAAADLDRDGDVDLVVAAGAGAPDRAYLSASGSYSSVAIGAATVDSRAVAVGDVNGDAFVDLVFATASGGALLVNSGSGASFAAPRAVGTGDARDALLVDLNGDTLPELVLAKGDGDAAVYRNNAGAFTLEGTLATGPTSAVAAGDFNADGRADLAFGRDTATSPAVPSALVWLNAAGAGSQLNAAAELGAAATSGVLVKDFNLDGRTDVLAMSSSGERIFTNAGAATFVLHPLQLATPGGRGVAAGRFSNDERIDIVVVGDGIGVFVNDGNGNFGSGDTTPPTLTLRGAPSVTLMIDSPYTDAGATATDTLDGDLTSRIVVVNPVNTALIGTATITYSVTDLSGNAATPVTRTVTVQAQPPAGGGGGGALGSEIVLILLLAALSAQSRRTGRGRQI